MNLNNDISGKKSLIAGLVLMAASVIGKNYAGESDVVLLFSLIVFPLSLFLTGMALAKFFMEPKEQPLVDFVSVLSEKGIVRIPSNVGRYANFPIFFFLIPFFILINLMIRQNRDLGEVVFLLGFFSFMLVYILIFKNTQYFLYPDKILIKRTKFWNKEIPFKDISSISIASPSTRGTLPRQDKSDVLASGVAAVAYMLMRKGYAEEITIFNKNRKKYFLWQIVHPEHFVNQLKKIVGN